jgi:hypothetical protein
MTRDQIRAYQRLKTMTNEQFWSEMDIMHTRAYNLAMKHYTEAGEITLTPKQQKALHDKAKKIREEWDNISEVKI